MRNLVVEVAAPILFLAAVLIVLVVYYVVRGDRL